jgi:hypothetical protein
MNIAGTWVINQTIDSKTFTAQFGDNGSVSVNAGPGFTFFGTWVQSASGEVAFALTQSTGGSLTTYQGIVTGNSMSGPQVGTDAQGNVTSGTWNATTSVS